MAIGFNQNKTSSNRRKQENTWYTLPAALHADAWSTLHAASETVKTMHNCTFQCIKIIIRVSTRYR